MVDTCIISHGILLWCMVGNFFQVCQGSVLWLYGVSFCYVLVPVRVYGFFRYILYAWYRVSGFCQKFCVFTGCFFCEVGNVNFAYCSIGALFRKIIDGVVKYRAVMKIWKELVVLWLKFGSVYEKLADALFRSSF